MKPVKDTTIDRPVVWSPNSTTTSSYPLWYNILNPLAIVIYIAPLEGIPFVVVKVIIKSFTLESAIFPLVRTYDIVAVKGLGFICTPIREVLQVYDKVVPYLKAIIWKLFVY